MTKKRKIKKKINHSKSITSAKTKYTPKGTPKPLNHAQKPATAAPTQLSTIPSKNSSSQVSFPVVAVGASAGGLEAVSQLLKQMPADSGAAVVIVQHLDPKHESLTAEILARITAMPVTEVKDGMPLTRNHVYVIAPDSDLSLDGGAFRLSPRALTLGLHLPIDFFFNSAAEQAKGHAIGVVLSGTGSDGTQGLLVIKSEGGVTFAQEPKSAKFAGMPENSIASGAVDFVLTPAAIADEITRISHHPFVAKDLSEAPPTNAQQDQEPLPKDALEKIFSILRNRVQVDFSNYKHSTILRRLARRILIVKQKNLSDYANYLETNPEEATALFADILIHVTEFFRDAEAFLSLQCKALPEYMKNREAKTPFRIWVVGCSTGEEAYSLAILLLEYFDETATRAEVQIFASDVSERAIQRARTGLYSTEGRGISKVRLEKFFEKVDAGHRVKKRVRDLCIFSCHDVTRDPPFAKVDLIACRNLLIYFDEELQKRVLPIFHYALKSGGILFLGKAENTGAFANLFSASDKVNKIFLKKNVKTPVKIFVAPLRTPPVAAETQLRRIPSLTAPQGDIQTELDRIALRVYAPPSIVINDSMEILQVRGRTSPFLEIAPGQPSFSLLKMARPELIKALRKLIQAVRTKDRPVKKEGLDVLENNRITTFSVLVTPIKYSKNSNERCYAIFFEVSADQIASKSKTPTKTATKGIEIAQRKSREAASRARDLLELQQSKAEREHFQALSEEYESGQEELTAANEELQSANEELQSTNEEMETAREELQSSNEELTTVNDELQTRNIDMAQINADLTNLLESTELPIVLVGSDCRIRRFTPEAKKQLKVITGDIGRRISDLKPDIGAIDLEKIAIEVMSTGAAKELETSTEAGHWYKLIVKPYHKHDGKIDGAVIALFDIDSAHTTCIKKQM